jgi:glycosyltransferase involved in cell wall biosynthesis
VRAADLIAVEGTVYATFVKKWNGNPPFYFPNYVRWTGAHERRACPAPGEAGETWLVTLGRVVPEKGVELSIDLLKALRAKGIAASLEIIGGGDTAYISHLSARCRSMPVVFTGPLPPAEVMKRLASRHFFIFASAHSGEGHSNALTEAMACGVVPICSDNGFNQDVVADAGFVLPRTATVLDYSNCIARFHGDDELWRTLSRRASARVRDHFSHDQIIPELIGRYTKLVPGPRRSILAKEYSL